MTAKEMVIEHAPEWTEEQARRALEAAESDLSPDREERIAKNRALMARAAEFRARQSEPSDVVALAREAREELERRGS